MPFCRSNPSWPLKPSGLIQDLFKVLSFRLRLYPICKYSVVTRISFKIRSFQLKLASLLPVSLRVSCFSKTVPVQMMTHSFVVGAILWKLVKKVFGLIPLESRYFLKLADISLQAV